MILICVCAAPVCACVCVCVREGASVQVFLYVFCLGKIISLNFKSVCHLQPKVFPLPDNDAEEADVSVV